MNLGKLGCMSLSSLEGYYGGFLFNSFEFQGTRCLGPKRSLNIRRENAMMRHSANGTMAFAS